MKIGIIGAMPQEVKILASLLENKTVTKIANCTLFQGKIAHQDIALIQSGIGKVAAAMGATLLLNLAKPNLVLNTGSAGGVGDGLAIGDVVISTETLHYDADVTAFGYAKGQLPACPARFASDENLVKHIAHVAQAQGQVIKFGLIASGDSFVQGGTALIQIKRDFPDVLAVEMEAAAIAQVCFAFKVPFVVIRAISDIGNDEANLSFAEFLPIAAEQSSKMILALLETL